MLSWTLSGLLWISLRRREPPRVIIRPLVMVSFAYATGFLFLNMALVRLAAAYTETVRGLEPLTTFLLARLLGGRGATLHLMSASALVTVLFGAAFCIWSLPHFDLRGLVLGLLANLMFSSRSLLVTIMQAGCVSASQDSSRVSYIKHSHLYRGTSLCPSPLHQDRWRDVCTTLGHQHVPLDALTLFATQHALGTPLSGTKHALPSTCAPRASPTSLSQVISDDNHCTMQPRSTSEVVEVADCTHSAASSPPQLHTVLPSLRYCLDLPGGLVC